MRRQRNAKIVATLGPASATQDIIRSLFDAGVDTFRLNFSHGSHEQHRERLAMIREVERSVGRPIGVLMDLQGPKLRVGTFADGPVTLAGGAGFRLDLDTRPGDVNRVCLPHPEIFAALEPGTELLLDDGKISLRVTRCGSDFAQTQVMVGGVLSERKGVNVPHVVLPLSALTAKDRRDLEFGLELGVDWLALSFVQRPEDIDEARELVRGRAQIMTKLEKPAAVERLDEIIARSDAVMVARGDLGVELPAEQVPAIQKLTVRNCRAAGKPVIVATQMLESMVNSPVPTRAEASDVATAIYDGADAVMLSAESASGRYPLEAVRMMDRIIQQVESGPIYRQLMEASHTPPEPTIADAICCALRHVTRLMHPAAIVTYTSSGHTSLRAARERPEAPILSMTPTIGTARRLAFVWGVHSVHTHEIADVPEMVDYASQTACSEGFAKPGDIIAITAGMPFATAGTTNLLRIAQI
ncbi:MAG: pyruvate kinase [Hydrocarboniphaga sp.]|uniref:pyruvate kinase n=1 Tax=Hydrocarboniphaga sp. TaxID=2033016 RepID=UPI002612C48F|nr:pyruvate kinase [Hydrocarboniphaga sp.]MDB5969320.1 pyruvate kinase [Hydrocarboniphaga sp.]